MADSNGNGMPFNLTAVMALLTVLGGAFLISRPLASSRPGGVPAGPEGIIGSQLVESRLWEDPFAHFSTTDAATAMSGMDRIRGGFLLRSNVLVLPVMLPGGRYAEDQEARIRSRYAVVSALGNRSYVPADAEHIGIGAMPWPSTGEIQAAMVAGRTWDWLAGYSEEAAPSTEKGSGSGTLKIAFEWYRGRTFGAGLGSRDRYQHVLVVYLNEDIFEDYPRLRLALWQDRLDRDPAITNRVGAVRLIGPRRSSTLRAMVPPGPLSTVAMNPVNHPEARFATEIERCLNDREHHRVEVFSPTSSAIDAVLIAGDPTGTGARAGLVAELSKRFASFTPFCATDGELSAAAINELRLRDLDLTRTDGTGPHVVLIHEWDTFYGRMMSLAFASELAKAQGSATNARQFLSMHQSDGAWPTNLHRFVYLRGLDGQTAEAPERMSEADPESAQPASLKQLELLVADPNKAEGRAQLDSLSRLGGELEDLDFRLRSDGASGIGAIGVLGSDVYDTLLILQALRARFPNALFFTTDLDARYWHRSEREWSRNLIVLSSYGLALEKKLQGAVPPFRDSSQAGQFAATLAALGSDAFSVSASGMAGPFPVRRFEIGREGGVNLSGTNAAWLGATVHPDRNASVGIVRIVGSNWRWLFLAAGAGGALLVLFVRPLRRRLTGESKDFLLQSLWLRSEDLGEEDGARFLLDRILKDPDPDPISAWLVTDLHVGQTQEETESLVRSPVLQTEQLLTYLNGLLQQPAIFPKSVVAESRLIGPATKIAYARDQVDQQGFFLLRNSSDRVRLNRRVLDEYLDALTGDVPVAETGGGYAARGAVKVRRAGMELNRVRRLRMAVFRAMLVAAVVVFGSFFVVMARQSVSVEGEPVSLFAGTSIWPTELIRLGGLFLSLVFVAAGYFVLRENVVTLSRQFRLPLFDPEPGRYAMLPSLPPPVLRVYAKDLWNRYQQFGFFGRRSLRTLIRFALYYVFALGLFKAMEQVPLVPGRGAFLFQLDRMILYPSIVAFLFLTFWVMDAVQLCRWLIERLSEAPTHYPGSCREHFRRLLGLNMTPAEEKAEVGDEAKVLNRRDVDETVQAWIDLRLVVELTEKVGNLIYFPFIVFFLMLVSRSDWWDHWTWPPALKIVFGLNLVLMVCSAILLQRAANRARDKGVERLKTRISRLEHETMAKAENDLSKARMLLDEIQSLRRGAFAPFWENPILGAILVPSGGTVVLQLASYFLNQ